MYATELDVPLAHQAAAQGNINKLTRAIKADPTVLEHQDTEGLTPLGHAVMSQQLESVKLLMKLGASINEQDQLGRTGLSVAAYQGWHEGVVLLLRHGAKQNVVDKSGRTALHSATYPTETNVLGALLQNISSEEITIQDNEGMTALHWACFHNRPKHAQLLLLKDINPFLQDIDGRNALHWAAQNGSLPCVTVLIHIEGSSSLISQVDFSEKMAIHFAAAAGHCEVIQELATMENGYLQAEDNDERTPLHWAAATGQAEAVRTLLELGVDPSSVDVDEGTPLDYARQSGHWECVQILEQRLGIRTVAPITGGSTEVTSTSIEQQPPLDSTKARKNPFGFIVDLFRPKNKSSTTELSLPRPNHGQRLEISEEDLVSTNLTSEEWPEEHSSSAADTNFSVTMVNAPQRSGSSSLPGSKLSTPVKRQRDSEVLKSMEMIHLSREDNPVLLKIRNSQQSLLVVGGHSSSSSISSDLGKERSLPPVVATAVNSELGTSSNSNEVVPLHHALVRSPPPVIKRQHSPLSRENSLSPVPSVYFPLRSDYTRAQIENDAAEILALQNHMLQQQKPPQPQQQRGSQNSTPRSSIHGKSSPTDSPVLHRTTSGSEEEGGSGRDLSKGRKIRLAPLRGPVPQSQHSPSSPLVNKPLQMVKQGETVENRPPTPPVQPSPRYYSSSSQNFVVSNDTSPKLNKRKKKRKSNNIETSDIMVARDSIDHKKSVQEVNNFPKDLEPSLFEQRKARDSIDHKKAVQEVNNFPKESGPSSFEQRKAIDKSIRNLLQ